VTVRDDVLQCLRGHEDGLTFGQIAVQLGKTSATLSPILSRMGKELLIYKYAGRWILSPLTK
jgi:DNA-binding MarR family transcriptional regulator